MYPDLSFRFFDPISNQVLRSDAEAEFERVFEQRARFQAELERSFEHQARLDAEAIAEQERLIAAQERNEKLQERQEKEKLATYLRSLGINPDEIP